jgi:hypothetical protein
VGTVNELSIKRGVSTSKDAAVAARELFAALDQPDIEFALFYCDPDYDLEQLGAALAEAFEGVALIGCTTAGEITPAGYLRGSLTGVSIGAGGGIRVTTACVDNVAEFEFHKGDAIVGELKAALSQRGDAVTADNTFAFLLVDGLCNREEWVVSSLHRSLADVSLFGGSAADGTKFGATHVYFEGAFRQDVALLTLFQTELPFKVFKTQHFVPSTDRMVVTEADAPRRIVSEINGERAAREYARMVGLEVEELTPLIFSTYPVVVRIGGSYYVRSIQKVNDDESLTFFCAIDEGIVLTVARGVDMVDNLEQTFDEVRRELGPPQLVLGCDCILRHLEMDQRGIKQRVGSIMAQNNVIGFSTYGEQFNAMHVNQTFTGAAIGSPRTVHG